MMEKRKLFVTLVKRGLFSLIMVAAVLLVSAGSMNYLEAWIFLIVFGISAFFFGTWLLICHPEQLYNRFRTEQNQTLRRTTRIIALLACSALVVAGFDKRFGWSYRSDYRYIFSSLLLICAILLYRNVFIYNPFLSNSVEIHEGHTVVQEGMYRYVRHPMYLATICACAAGLIILGSWYTLPFYLAFVGFVAFRIVYEERQLQDAIPDYYEYSKKVKYRLVPYIW